MYSLFTVHYLAGARHGAKSRRRLRTFRRRLRRFAEARFPVFREDVTLRSEPEDSSKHLGC